MDSFLNWCKRSYSRTKDWLIDSMMLLINVALVVGIMAVSISHTYKLMIYAGLHDWAAVVFVAVWETVFIYASIVIDRSHKRKKRPIAAWIAFLMGLAVVEISNYMFMASNPIGKGIAIATPILLLVMKSILKYQMSEDEPVEKRTPIIQRFANWIKQSLDAIKQIFKRSNSDQSNTNQTIKHQVQTVKSNSGQTPNAEQRTAEQTNSEKAHSMGVVGEVITGNYQSNDEQIPNNIKHRSNSLPVFELTNSRTANITNTFEQTANTLLPLGQTPDKQQDSNRQTRAQTVVEQSNSNTQTLFEQTPNEQQLSDTQTVNKQSNNRIKHTTDKQTPVKQQCQTNEQTLFDLADEIKQQTGKYPSIRKFAEAANITNHRSKKILDELKKKAS